MLGWLNGPQLSLTPYGGPETPSVTAGERDEAQPPPCAKPTNKYKRCHWLTELKIWKNFFFLLNECKHIDFVPYVIVSLEFIQEVLGLVYVRNQL